MGEKLDHSNFQVTQMLILAYKMNIVKKCCQFYHLCFETRLMYNWIQYLRKYDFENMNQMFIKHVVNKNCNLG